MQLEPAAISALFNHARPDGLLRILPMIEAHSLRGRVWTFVLPRSGPRARYGSNSGTFGVGVDPRAFFLASFIPSVFDYRARAIRLRWRRGIMSQNGWPPWIRYVEINGLDNRLRAPPRRQAKLDKTHPFR